MPIQITQAFCRFDCVDCGHTVEYPLATLDTVKTLVCFTGKCPACGSENFVGVDLEKDINYTTPEEFAAGARPSSGPVREKG